MDQKETKITRRGSQDEIIIPKVLIVKFSPMGDYSAGNNITGAFVEEYKRLNPTHEIVQKNYAEEPLQPFTKQRAYGCMGKFDEEGREQWKYNKALIEFYKSFDKFVFAIPMWNLGIPNQLKLLIDHIAVSKLTFGKDGGILGKGKPILCINTSGWGLLGSPMDQITPYMNHVLKFLGFTDIRQIQANGTALNREEVIKKSCEEAVKIAAEFLFNAQNQPLDLPAKIAPSTESFGNGKKVLYLRCSPKGEESASRLVSQKFLHQYIKKIKGSTLTVKDLFNCSLPWFTAKRVQAKVQPFTQEELSQEAKDEWEFNKKLIKEFIDHDTIVISAPVWNMNIPYTLKLYIDHIIQPFLTFDPQTNQGLVKGKRLYIIRASGCIQIGGKEDYGTAQISAAFGTIGFTDIKIAGVSKSWQDRDNKITETVSELVKNLE